MRRLQPHEKAQTGDWFLLFDHAGADQWIQLDSRPMPLKRDALRTLDQNNKTPHYPLVVLRPSQRELEQGTAPKYIKFSRAEQEHISRIRNLYQEK